MKCGNAGVAVALNHGRDCAARHPVEALQRQGLRGRKRLYGAIVLVGDQSRLGIAFRGKINAHETTARNMRARFLERGELDFADARSVALARLRDPACGAILGPAFAARFLELIVDEAQDCNPAEP